MTAYLGESDKETPDGCDDDYSNKDERDMLRPEGYLGGREGGRKGAM